MLDVLIKNGWVVDGTGNPRYLADVAIQADRIVAVERLKQAQATTVIDATDKIVCPGFVDCNGHSDWTFFSNPTQESTIRQGVTTEVVGNCGNGFAPVTDSSREFVTARLRTYAYDGSVPWSGYGQYLDCVAGLGTSANFAFLVGHNTVRLAAGVAGSVASADQVTTMRGYVREAMHAGALGMSTGLEFEPGIQATTDELVDLAKIVGEYDGYYASHIRNRDEFLQHAIDEFLRIARESGVGGAEIGHLNVRYGTGAAEGAWRRAVDSVQLARSCGLNVLCDTTPFRYGTGLMISILPPWIATQGPTRIAELLRTPSVRARLRMECDRYWRFLHRGEWDRVYLQGDQRFPEYAGKDFVSIGRMTGRDPWDVYFDIMVAAGPQMESMQFVGMLFTDEHLAEMIRHPLFSLTADTWSSRIDGPLAEQTRHSICFAGHVHFLTHHTRTLGTLGLEYTIRKMTSMPANHYRVRDRGLLRPGAFADVVVFDYDGLDDVSTLEHPTAYARGIEHVFINGTHVLVDGGHTARRPGRQLLRDW